jgi:hypothetical protein
MGVTEAAALRRLDMDADEGKGKPIDGGDGYLMSFARACDEVLEYHDRAGNGDTQIVKELRAKRAGLLERLNGRVQATDDLPGHA